MDIIYILAIETSATSCSVSLSANGKALHSLSIDEEKTHAQKILILIHQILEQSQISMNQLLAISVSSGPGSYTGLRIGVSVAKGLCVALEIPLIPINTLYSLAMETIKSFPTFEYYVPMIDARRMEVYTMIVNLSGDIVQNSHPLILDIESYIEIAEGVKTVFFGSGMAKFGNEIAKNPLWHYIPNIIPVASDQNFLAYQSYIQKEFVNIYSFEPQYLKQFHLITA